MGIINKDSAKKNNKAIIEESSNTTKQQNGNSKSKGKSKKTGTESLLSFMLFLLKLLAVPVFGLVMFMIGMYIGYDYGGLEPSEVFEADTWRNIFLIIFG